MKTLNELFEKEEDFKEHVDNLWQTRSGLHCIFENRPDLKDALLPQLKTLDAIISTLIEERPYHPKLGFYGSRKLSSNTCNPTD